MRHSFKPCGDSSAQVGAGVMAMNDLSPKITDLLAKRPNGSEIHKGFLKINDLNGDTHFSEVVGKSSLASAYHSEYTLRLVLEKRLDYLRYSSTISVIQNQKDSRRHF